MKHSQRFSQSMRLHRICNRSIIPCSLANLNKQTNVNKIKKTSANKKTLRSRYINCYAWLTILKFRNLITYK